MRGRKKLFLRCVFSMKYLIIFSVISKSAITPSFIGRMASMLPGVLPTISFASLPTARIRGLPPPYLSRSMATTEGSFMTMPLSLTSTRVFAVPRSMPISLEKNPTIWSKIILHRLFGFDK